MYRALAIPIFVALMPMFLFLLALTKLLFPRVVMVKWANILGMLVVDILAVLLITLN